MTDKLDPKTEQLIEALPRLAQALMGHTTVKILPLGEAIAAADAYDLAENDLRDRIRELIQDARDEANNPCRVR